MRRFECHLSDLVGCLICQRCCACLLHNFSALEVFFATCRLRLTKAAVLLLFDLSTPLINTFVRVSCLVSCMVDLLQSFVLCSPC